MISIFLLSFLISLTNPILYFCSFYYLLVAEIIPKDQRSNDLSFIPKAFFSGKIPAHNQKDFYQGISDGVANAGQGINKSGRSLCPSGHTAEYCAGFNFGANWEDYAM